MLKTTKSGFVNFVKDSYTSLPDVSDRILSTVVDARWTYKSLNGLNFCQAFNEVEKALLDHFAGPPDTGLFSPSVQQTLYHAQVSHKNSSGGSKRQRATAKTQKGNDAAMV